MKPIDSGLRDRIDGVYAELAELHSSGLKDADPIAFNHHLTEIMGNAQRGGLSTNWETILAAYAVAPKFKPSTPPTDAPADVEPVKGAGNGRKSRNALPASSE